MQNWSLSTTLGLGGSVMAIARGEWRQLIHTPLTYVFQLSFLLALNIGIFLVADFYSTDEASIRLLVTLLPWVALVFVPALAMRIFSEGPGDRNLELTATLPVSAADIVLGKFLANGALVLLTLAFSLPFIATIAFLGEPEWGGVFCGLLGLALLLLLFLSTAQFAASFAREPVAAFLYALALLFFLMMLGWDGAARLLRGGSLSWLADPLAALGPGYWLGRLAAGRLELAAFVYFAALTAAFLYGATRVIMAQRFAGGVAQRRSGDLAGLAICFVALAFGTALLRQVPLALDLTAEREFTLHPGTIQLLNRLPADTRVDFYWSEGEAAVPASIRSHARRTENLLRTMVANAHGRLSLVSHSVTPDSDAEMRGEAAGIRLVPMSSGDRFMLGAMLSRGGRQVRIGYFDVARERNLEYDLALALDSLSKRRTPRLGILSPLLTPRNARQPRPGLSFLEEIKGSYDVAIIPHFADSLPEGLDTLLVIDASILKPSMLAAIDKHVMSGRGLIVFIDPRVRFNPGSDQVRAVPSAEINDISDLLLRYGVRYLGSAVVGDGRLASRVADDAGQQITYPYWLSLGAAQMAADHPVTANLSSLLFVEPGALAIEAGASAVPLVTTSGNSGTLPLANFAGKSVEVLGAAFKSDSRKRVLAAALRGPFNTAFGGRQPKSPTSAASTAAQSSSAIFVVADVDWIFDPASVQLVESDGGTMPRPLNDNRALLMNMLEYASGSPSLIAIRSRGRLSRPFTKVAEVVRLAGERYKSTEADLIRRIGAVESRLNEVMRLSGAKSIDALPKVLKARVTELRQGLLGPRRELKRIRQKMRQSAQSLGRNLTLLNLVIGPLLVLGFALLSWLSRRRPSVPA